MTPINLYEGGAGNDEGTILPVVIGAALGAVTIVAGVVFLKGLDDERDEVLAKRHEARGQARRTMRKAK